MSHKTWAKLEAAERAAESVEASNRLLRRNAADATSQEDFDARTGDVAALQQEIVALREEVESLRARLSKIGDLAMEED